MNLQPLDLSPEKCLTESTSSTALKQFATHHHPGLPRLSSHRAGHNPPRSSILVII